MFLIWGTTEHKSQVTTGAFHCPDCDTRRAYERSRTRIWFDVFFIPLIPLTRRIQVVCRTCGTNYPEEMLRSDLRAPRHAAALRHAVRRVALEFMASGGGDPAERAALQESQLDLTGQALDAAEVDQEITRARADPRPLAQHLATLASQIDTAAKEGLLKTALAIARLDGPLSAEERERVAELATALQMSDAHLEGVLAADQRSSTSIVPSR